MVVEAGFFGDEGFVLWWAAEVGGVFFLVLIELFPVGGLSGGF